MSSSVVRLDPYKHMTVKHHFIGGIYAKECHLPVGIRFEQHRHKHSHMSVLASGTALVEVDGIQVQYEGPAVLNIEAKKAHSITPITPCIWICQHVTTCTDPDEIDEEFIERSQTDGS